MQTIPTKKRLALNVVMNWAGTAVNMVVPFFLTPFVVRHLGVLAYGVWVVSVSTVSYLNLLDMGMRSAVIRYVSKAQATGQMEDARRAVHAALWFRLLISSGVALLSIALAWLAPHLFKIPADLARAAQVTMLLCGLGVAVTLTSGVFGAVLAAINRFDVLSTIAMIQTVVRAGGVLLILMSGRGLISLACWELTVLTISAVAVTTCAVTIFPHSRVRPGKPDTTVMRMIWSYSFTTFIFMIAVQIITNTDSLVIGAFLSVGMVTFFAIGSSLISYGSQVSTALSTTFTPIASGLEASGRMDDLRRMLIQGTQATLALSLPIMVGLLFRGGTFIRLWMGPEYEVISEKVVWILSLSMFFGIADATAASIMMAIEKHKSMTRWAVFEAFFNLGLSIVLVKKVGLYGVAWGTSISMVITHVCFWPREVKKRLGVEPMKYVWEGWSKPVLCVVPFAILCALEDRYLHPVHLVTFFVQIAAALPLYGLCAGLLFRSHAQALFQRWRARRRPLASTAS